MVVEPFANDKLEDNLNPDRAHFLRRFHHALHTCFAIAGSRLGPRGAGWRGTRLSKILKTAGFSSVRRAAETPFNIVLEVRP